MDVNYEWLPLGEIMSKLPDRDCGYQLVSVIFQGQNGFLPIYFFFLIFVFVGSLYKYPL